MGYWFLLEMIGFVLIPTFVFFYGYRSNSILVINIAAIMTSIGVILNRMNVSIIAYNWNLPVRYIPTWMEVVVMVGIIFTQIWIFRWIVNRMPVLRDSPSWAKDSH
jgi:Ni/Fe-hydrogenase subunit HybB-like protein